MFLRRLLSYGVGYALARVVAIVLLPLYTRLVSPEEYGKADLTVTTSTVLASAIFLEVWTALLRAAVVSDGDENHSLSAAGNAFAFFVLTSPLAAAAVVVLAGILGTGYAWPGAAYAVVLGLNSLMQAFARGRGSSGVFVTSGVIASLVQLLVVIVAAFVFHISGGWLIVVAPCAGFILSTIFIEVRLGVIRNLPLGQVNRAEIGRLVKFAAPLAASAVAYWLLTQFNTYYVATTIGFESSSILAVAARYSSVLLLFTTIFNFAWQESAFSFGAKGISSRFEYYQQMMHNYVAVTCILAVAFVSVTPLVLPILVGPTFARAESLAPSYVLAVFVGGIGTFLAQLYGAEARTALLMISTLTGAGANIVVLLLLVPRVGLVGAPYALLVGQLVTTLIRYWLLQNVVSVRLNVTLLLRVLGLVGVAFIGAVVGLTTAARIGVVATAGVLAILLFNRELIVILRSVRRAR